MTVVTRRAFVASAAAFAAVPALGAMAATGQVDLAIVGAGAAGIAAARRAAASGARYVLLEAGERAGGRCITDSRTFGVPFDRGAHWIRQGDVNPLAKLAARPLEVYAAPPGQKIRIGRRNAREGEVEQFLAGLVRAQRAVAEAARGKADVPAAQVLPKELGDWRPTVEFVLGSYTAAKDLAEVSATDLSKAPERGNDFFCRQGFGALLAKAAENLSIQLSAPVSRVQWDRGLELETPKGTIEARAIIITVSTDVLAAGKIRFSPDLPKRQLDAAARLKLGTYERIALELPGNPLGLQTDELVFEKSERSATAVLLANASGTPLCFVDVGGRFGRELAEQGENAMVAFATDWLSGLFGADIKRAVKRSAATQWGKHPWVLGAWASAAPGAQSSRRVLMEPLRDRIWFAGEAVHETQWGTVNGAWESGERAADAALRKLGLFKEVKESKPPQARSSGGRQPRIIEEPVRRRAGPR